MKTINRKEEVSKNIEVMDIIESDMGYFYQIHNLNGKYVAVCLNEELRGIIAGDEAVDTTNLRTFCNYLEDKILSIKHIHKATDSKLVIENL